VFYGDAARLDLLRTAGIDHARVMLLALDDEAQSLRVAELVREHYPQLRLVVRAHNRFSVLLYRKLGVEAVVRELLPASLAAAELVLEEYGFVPQGAQRLVGIFQRHDEDTLEKSLELQGDMEALIDHTRYSREHLAALFEQDRAEMNR
jgi:CPA2 family monovalent cation:H+ antiporter-2